MPHTAIYDTQQCFQKINNEHNNCLDLEFGEKELVEGVKVLFVMQLEQLFLCL